MLFFLPCLLTEGIEPERLRLRRLSYKVDGAIRECHTDCMAAVPRVDDRDVAGSADREIRQTPVVETGTLVR